MKSLDLSLIRSLDVAAALAGGLIALPVVLGVALLIRADSPGPALFRQTRVGRGGAAFTCYKLRTMAQGTRLVGTHEVCASAVTPLGRTLRRLKLDELPQLWNVLKGDMSLVGPRPCLPTQVELVEQRTLRGVYAVRPGITGRAQIAGLDMSTPVELAREDAVWADRPRVGEYLKLVLLTVIGKGQGDRVRA